jgi:hypothetical protein
MLVRESAVVTHQRPMGMNRIIAAGRRKGVKNRSKAKPKTVADMLTPFCCSAKF